MRILIRPFSSRIFLAPSLLVQLLQNHRAGTIIIAALISTVTSGCFVQYGKTNSRSAITADSLQQLINQGKFLILHFADQATAIKNPSITGQELTGESSTIPEEHSYLLSGKHDPKSILPEGQFTVKKKNKELAFQEVHLYTRNVLGEKTSISLPINSFYRIDVMGLDKGATQTNKIMSIIGLTFGSFALFVLIFYLIDPMPYF